MSQSILEHEATLELPDPLGTGTGRAKDTQDMHVDGVISGGDFTGGWACQVQGSADGATWVNIGSSLTAAGTVIEGATVPNLLPTWRFMRVNATVAGSAPGPDIQITGHKRNYG